MREIIFRGKRIDNGEWIIGNLIHQLDFYGEPVDKCFITDKNDTYDLDIGEPIEVIPETIGQYIGQKDKNGIKIYDGDIIQYVINKHKYIVTINDFCVGTIDEKGEKLMLGRIHNDFEVIGNIHEGEQS